jgi:hypothetical protein
MPMKELSYGRFSPDAEGYGREYGRFSPDTEGYRRFSPDAEGYGRESLDTDNSTIDILFDSLKQTI